MFFLEVIRHESKTPIKDSIVSKFNRPNDHIPRKVLTPIVKNFELGISFISGYSIIIQSS
jgi:hypothetical protein